MSRPAGESAPAAPRSPGSVPLRHNSGFRMLWIGQILSDTGTGAALIAYPLLVLVLSHSAAIAGIVGTVRLAAQLVLGLPGGALSDRFDRRLTMIGCDTVRAAVLGVLVALVVLHAITWPIVLVVAVIDGGAGVLFDPAAAAALPAIVADDQLEKAWAATEARTYGAGLAGPALGGFLFGLGNAIPFIADCVSYLVSAGTVSRIRGRFRPERADGRKALWREVIEGMQLVWQHPLLRAVCLQAPLVNFAVTGVIFTITVALREHGTAPGIIGLTQAGVGAGGLLGAVAAPWMQGRMSLWRLVIALTVAASVLFALAALVLPSPLVAVPVAVTLFLAPTANAALFAAMLRSAPEDMRGRVSSSVILGAAGLAALSPLTAGLLVQHFSGRWAMLAFAATMALAAVMCITLPGLKETESAAGRASAAESEAAESEAAESEAAESEAAEPGAG